MGTFPPPLKSYLRPEYVPEYPDMKGGDVLIVGGGPSLNDYDWREIRAWEEKEPHRYTIAVNEAMLTVHPTAFIGYWVDARWYQWNRHRMQELCRVRHRMTSAHGLSIDFGGGTYVQNSNDKKFWVTDRRYVAGRDSGGIAINLAYHCGAKRVFLLGFDMRDVPKEEGSGNFHDKHKAVLQGTPRSSFFIPAHEEMAEIIRDLQLDLKVYNVTPNSALTCWDRMEWSEIQ